MVRSTTFWNLIAKRYSRTPIADESVYQKKLEITRRYFKTDSAVLEIGCGTGSTALAHAPYVKHIRAIDFSAKMIEIAEKKRLACGVDNVDFECATIDNIDPGVAGYDLVLGLNVIHLLRDWRPTLTTIERLLKPGGFFVSSTACLGDSMPWFKYVAFCGRTLGILPDLAVFTSTDLLAELARSGFDIEHQWHPGKNAAVFCVAVKPAQ